MKSVIRKVDSNGRVHIPHEAKSVMDLNDGDGIEILFDENEIVIKKTDKSKRTRKSVDPERENSSKKYFKIPVEWSSAGIVEIRAKTLEDAVKKFDGMKNKINHVYDSEMIYGTLDRIKSTGDNLDYYRSMQKFW